MARLVLIHTIMVTVFDRLERVTVDDTFILAERKHIPWHRRS